MVITGKTVTTEDKTTNDRLQQIVGETHATKDAEMMEYATNIPESIPRRDYC